MEKRKKRKKRKGTPHSNPQLRWVTVMIQEILQHHRGFREEEELRKVGVKSHCNQYLYLAFREERRKKVWTTEVVPSLWPTMPRVSGLVLKVAWQFRVNLPRRCIWENSLTIRNFRAGLWTSEQRFARRRRIPRALCSGSRKSEQSNRWPHHSKVRNGQRFPWLWIIGFDDGVSIEKVLR